MSVPGNPSSQSFKLSHVEQRVHRPLKRRELSNTFHFEIVSQPFNLSTMDLTSGIEKMCVGQQPVFPGVRGATCLSCKGICSGFIPHSWRKVCTVCGCSVEDHGSSCDLDDDHKIGRLLADSKYAHLTAKVKGIRVYKRNRMVVTNSVVSKKDPTFNTITYDWAPPGLTQKLAMLYMALVPEEKRPVAGTEGAMYRRRQLMRQLPVYDQDPSLCNGSLSEDQLQAMSVFMKCYKEEALGVGEVALPGEGGANPPPVIKGHRQKNGAVTGGPRKAPIIQSDPNTTSTNGTDDHYKKSKYHCSGCGELTPLDSPVVYAEGAGYDKQWHPTCFVCSECGEALVDLVYFWKEGELLCGRHYCQRTRPRCAGCDELIFCEDYKKGIDSRAWHQDHYCCWRCGQGLDSPCSCPQTPYPSPV